MFIVYINDLPLSLKQSNALMYADDTVLYCSSSSAKAVRKLVQADIDNVQIWCKKNRLKLNVSKTKIMTFMSDHTRKGHTKFRFYLKVREIEEVENYIYLGTSLDNRLSGETQYNKLMRNLGFKIKTFGKIRRFLTIKAALMVYKSTILPIIDYNDYFQFLWNSDKVHRLQKMQNWSLRIVYNNVQPRLDETGLHAEAGLELLETRRIKHLLNSMYFRSKNPVLLDDRNLPTRLFDKVKFKVIKPNVKKAFRSPNYLGAQYWDKLPRDTQVANTIHELLARLVFSDAMLNSSNSRHVRFVSPYVILHFGSTTHISAYSKDIICSFLIP